MPASDYVKLEQRLVLAAWGVYMLGYSSNKTMLEDMREVEEGYDSTGRSYLLQRILSRGAKCRVPRDDLERYDRNIRSHLVYFNKRLTEPLTLRYFQHVALLLTELFLDRLFNHDKQLRKDLQNFVGARNAKKPAGIPQDPDFNQSDLTKLAFWMATGSGKTILMHFNYRQFLHYNNKPLDNILLVTPDEGLSQQHIENMEAAGIPCARFSLEESGFEIVEKNRVRVIEITKLVEQKKGSGVSVPVEAFEGNNLIFVDEGHRGASSEAGKWVGYRAKLAETGFTFEYSATFGQALTAAGGDEQTKEYGKAILFDYSYKYFYGDGFGKDFEVLNLRQETTQEQTDILLLANLLAFYQQKRSFQKRSEDMLRYHLADPLWIFVGSTVNKSKDNKQAKESDVLTVVTFLSRFLENKKGWVQKTIKRILEGKSGIEDNGNDVFQGRFRSLKTWTTDADKISHDILLKVFHNPSGGRLHVGDIKGKAGELGLKVSSAENYFGLIYIGDTASFKALIETQCPDVELEDDQLVESLFENIKRPDSRINILIGAKKFMHGWDSWRVSNMGLLNIGRSEGSEIIQLFGRGVRLKGLNRSLKRSSALHGEHPKGIQLLEKLNIFAIRANYMAQFRDYLEREGIDPTGDVEFRLPIKKNNAFLKKGLIVPRLPKESMFVEQCDIMLEPEPAAKVLLDFSTKVERIGSSTGKFQTVKYVGGSEQWIPTDLLDWIDWEALYLDIIEFKEECSFQNLVIRPNDPCRILSATDPKLYGLICDDSLIKPNQLGAVMQLQDVLLAVLKKYVEKFYRLRQQNWDSDQMVYAALSKDDPNFQDYTVKVPRSDLDLVKAVKELIDEGKRIYKELVSELPNIHFDRHLYQPLLIQKGNKIKSAPPGLNEGEQRFVQDLIEFCRSKPASLKGKELFLLRNLSKGKGIGFFENSGFYPDFILWVKEAKSQRLIFIEPHGMLNEDHPTVNSKINLHKKLQDQTVDGLKKSKIKNVILDSFVISKTPYDELRTRICDDSGPWSREKFSHSHILFFDEIENREYLKTIFQNA
jgi:hypothetical protein